MRRRSTRVGVLEGDDDDDGEADDAVHRARAQRRGRRKGAAHDAKFATAAFGLQAADLVAKQQGMAALGAINKVNTVPTLLPAGRLA